MQIQLNRQIHRTKKYVVKYGTTAAQKTKQKTKTNANTTKQTNTNKQDKTDIQCDIWHNRCPEDKTKDKNKKTNTTSMINTSIQDEAEICV